MKARTRRPTGKPSNGKFSRSARRSARALRPKILSSLVKGQCHYNRSFAIDHKAWCKNQRRVYHTRVLLKLKELRPARWHLRTRFIRMSVVEDPMKYEMIHRDGARQPDMYVYRLLKALEGVYPVRVVAGWVTFLSRLTQGQCWVCGAHAMDGVGCHLRHLYRQFERCREWCLDYLLPLVQNCGDEKETLTYVAESFKQTLSFAIRLNLAITAEWISYFIFWVPGITQALRRVNMGLDVVNVGSALAGRSPTLQYSKATWLEDIARWFAPGDVSVMMSLFDVPWGRNKLPVANGHLANVINFLSKITGLNSVEVTFRLLGEINRENGWYEAVVQECSTPRIPFGYRHEMIVCQRLWDSVEFLKELRRFIPDLPEIERGRNARFEIDIGGFDVIDEAFQEERTALRWDPNVRANVRVPYGYKTVWRTRTVYTPPPWLHLLTL